MGSSNVYSSIETSKNQAKIVRIDFVRTLGNRQKFIATKRHLNQEKDNLKMVEKLCVLGCLCDPTPHSLT